MSIEVSIVKCKDYNPNNVEKALRECIGLLPENSIPKNKKILLKPNLLSSTKGPERPINTHPIFVECLAKILKEDYLSTVYIGDSCGGMSYGQTQRAFEVSGLIEISKKLGVQLINFENTGVVYLENENNKIKKRFPVTNFIQKVDFVISVPKLKTHTLVGYTGAVKNMMGLVPGSGKRDMHMTAPKVWQMEQCIVDLYGLVKPSFVVMDAIIGMEGDGPAAGDQRDIGLVFASSDAVALDTVAAEVVGYDSTDMIFIKEAYNRNYGVGDIKKISVKGINLEDVKISDFKKPIGKFRDAILNAIPSRLLKAAYAGMTSGLPIINQILCRRCNVCYDNCPVQTIDKFSDKHLEIIHKNCIECYCCQELCPHDAIKLKVPIAVSLVRAAIDVLRKTKNIFEFGKSRNE